METKNTVIKTPGRDTINAEPIIPGIPLMRLPAAAASLTGKVPGVMLATIT